MVTNPEDRFSRDLAHIIVVQHLLFYGIVLSISKTHLLCLFSIIHELINFNFYCCQHIVLLF